MVPYYLQYRLSKKIKQKREQTTEVLSEGISVD